MTKLSATFDYSSFDKDDKGKLINLAGQIKKARDVYDDSLFDLGEAIAHAHGVLAKHGSGSFVKWIELETGIENTTAYNYMYAWMRFHGFPNRNMLTAGAMYKLAAPKAPPAAAKEAEKLANKGERVTETVAAELVKKHKPEKVSEKVYSPVGKSEPVASQAVTKTDDSNTEESDDPIGDACTHEWDEDGDCKKCKMPRPAISGGTSFDPAEWEGDGKDGTGKEHDGDMAAVFKTAADFGPARQNLVKLKQAINRLKDLRGGELIQKGYQRIMSDLDNLDTEIKFAQPFAPCCYCKAKDDSCKACKGMGWLNKSAHEAAPKEKKRATA